MQASAIAPFVGKDPYVLSQAMRRTIEGNVLPGQLSAYQELNFDFAPHPAANG
jgi:hypothetical protein